MRRLNERQVVTLGRLDNEGRPRRCCVLGVGRDGVALYPIGPEPRETRTTSPGREFYLSFEHQGRPVFFFGEVQSVAANDLRFTPTDGIHLPRRATTRVNARVPFRIARVGTELQEATTVDFSAEGALIEDPGIAEVGDAVEFSFSPDEGAQIAGRAAVVRRNWQGLALAFHPLHPAERARIVDQVVAIKRTELERDVEAALARGNGM